jgi:hypothetical protein
MKSINRPIWSSHTKDMIYTQTKEKLISGEFIIILIKIVLHHGIITK